MDAQALASCYRLLGELLLYPEARDRDRIAETARGLETAPAPVRQSLSELLARPEVDDCEHYLAAFELAPTCPLYLGAYLFEEPDNCRGAAVSGRNSYMIEMAAHYRQFGLSLDGRELPDFLPVVLDFLALSAQPTDPRAIGARRDMVERYIRPALVPMRARFEQDSGPWLAAIVALEALLQADLGRFSVETPPARKESAAHQSESFREVEL